MDPPGERILARLAEALLEVEPVDVLLFVDGLDLDPRVGEPAGIIGTDIGRDAGMARVDAPVAGLYI